MKSTETIEALRQLTRLLRSRLEGEVDFSISGRALYTSDASNYRQVPLGVVYPRSVEDLIEIKICDYRDVEGQFDRIVSIEMLEAVGHEYLETYFAKCDDLLKPDGKAVIQVHHPRRTLLRLSPGM